MSTLVQSKFATRVDGVVSLYDLMLRYRLDYLAIFLTTCEIVLRDCRYGDSLGEPLANGSPEYYHVLGKVLDGLGLCVEQMDGDRTLVSHIRNYSDTIKQGKEHRPGVISAGLEPIQRGVSEILQHRLFMFIPEEQAKYYMNLGQFGDAVAMFPEAVGDMLEASNCYAAGRATACIFHSMRVAEHGLRHIADELGVSVSQKGKPCPVEFATWETVIAQIDNKRGEVRKEQKSREHEARTIQYAELGDTCSRLKDLWRNPIFHSRGLRSLEEALAAMTRVVDFMNLIAGSPYAPPVDPTHAKAMDVVSGMLKELAAYT